MSLSSLGKGQEQEKKSGKGGEEGEFTKQVGNISELPLHAAALHSSPQRVTRLPIKKVKTFINNQLLISVYV